VTARAWYNKPVKQVLMFVGITLGTALLIILGWFLYYAFWEMRGVPII